MSALKTLMLPVTFAAALTAVLPGSPASDQVPSGQRVLLLRTGRMLEGQVRRISTGWLVTQRNGHVVIPFDQVRFDAEDVEEVYQRLRLEVKEPTAGTHLKLADWCFSQKMLSEATAELRDALKLDPSNETARVMLHRVEQELRRQTQPAETTAGTPSATTGVLRIGAAPSSESPPEARSLSGLSPQTADDFVTRIQPLLANKCGNARCHGTAAKNDFRLEHVPSRSGSYRLRVERNLAATLKFVDPGMPLGSRLLMPIGRSHGGRPVFSGRFGAEQSQVLREWTFAAARELSATRRSRLRSVLASSEPQLIAPGTEATTSSPQVVSTLPSDGQRPGNEMGTAASPLSRPVGRTDGPELTQFQKLLIEVEDAGKEIDVFDPAEFNRRYATRQ
ncbi:MAG: tetratricopeptide repeat protein [Planctomycetota bacterium]|jgi:hypothetical protein